MPFKGHRPTGATSWPLILVAGAPKTGKSYTVAELTGSDLIGETFWIEFGEPTAEEYGQVPGARYILADHNGTFNDVLARVREAIAEPTRDGKPNLIVIDCISLIWELLSAEMQDVANRRRKADIDAETKITNDLWNIAKARWKKLIRLLRTHAGPVVVVARLEVVAVMDASGQPTKERTQKVQAHKSLPYDVDVIVQIPEYRRYQITGARSLVFNIAPGETFDAPADFTLDGLLRKMGLASLGVAAPRQFVEPVPSAQEAMAEFGGQQQEQPTQRFYRQPDDEFNTPTGQPTPPPSPAVPTVTPEQLGEMARLLKVKRGAVNGDRNRIIEQLVRRPVPDVQKLSQAEARSIIEALSAEPDHAPLPTVPEPTPVPDGPPVRMATEAQKKMMWATITEQGHTHDGGHVLMSRILRREITSTNQLTTEDASAVIKALGTGEIPPPLAAAPAGPNASGEGIAEFDALDQMILDVTSDEARAEVEQAITVEVGRGTITATGASVLRRRLAEHVAERKAGAMA